MKHNKRQFLDQVSLFKNKSFKLSGQSECFKVPFLLLFFVTVKKYDFSNIMTSSVEHKKYLIFEDTRSSFVLGHPKKKRINNNKKKKKKDGPNCASSFLTKEANWFDMNSEILVPSSCITKGSDGESYLEFDKSKATDESGVLILISVTFVMSILIYIGWRSKRPDIVDWLRLVTIYAAG
ncbi:hypothetical protein RFI_27168 [Reticulomyxa filosa]|uniref:Uncharacterized protein n=1 Tax=Reticulomyxa filosa TaxID=46433 RepID=X6M9Q4_RETFI|nr:hypothetical protein RFI_27168 [Reticulomyxa filosa]|eukprot:ETO10212.1 hypothetical protein RFI_27168 [Reticulomyxa filosa]